MTRNARIMIPARRWIAPNLLLIFAGILLGQAGHKAPPLNLKAILHAPAAVQANWQTLQGQWVILEFWATWCPGCRAAIPHLNNLAQAFQGRPVRFISITDEHTALVKRFLTEYPMSGWIGIDQQDKTFKNFHVYGRPQTFIVDPHGILRWQGPPVDLTSEMLSSLLAGKKIQMPEENPYQQQSLPNPFFEVMIRPAAPEAMVGYSPGAESWKSGSLRFWGATLRNLMSQAYGVPANRIVGPAWISTHLYDAQITNAGLSFPHAEQMLRQALRETFQLKLHNYYHKMPAYILLRRNGTPLGLHPAHRPGKSSWGDSKKGSLQMFGMKLNSLAGIASNILHQPVINETHIHGRYDFHLRWIASQPTTLTLALEKIGLQLKPARHNFKFISIDSAVAPRAW